MSNIVAIELGSEKIACVIASLEEGADKKVRIIGFASTPSRGIKRAQIIDIQETTKALEQCLVQAERMAGTRITKAILLTSGPNIASQSSHGIVAVNYQNQEIREEDVQRAIESAKAISLAANREIIHVLPKEFIVDGQNGIKNPVGMNGVRLEIETHIITASSTNLSNIQKACSLLGVEVEAFVFSGLAASYAVVNDTEKELGCVLLEVGAGISNLCVFVDGSIAHTAVIPLGSKNVSSDIAAGLRISLESAEKIKLHLAEAERQEEKKPGQKKPSEMFSDELNLSSLSLPEKMSNTSKKVLIDGIIKPRLEEIAEFVSNELQSFRLKDQAPAGIIITGGGAETPLIEQVLKKELSLPVRRGYPKELGGLSDELNEPRFAALVGSIFYRFEQKNTDKKFAFNDVTKIFSNIEFKGTMQKVVDFFKSFIPGTK